MGNLSAAERAALAFSAIPSRAAVRLSDRLSMTERMQLREGLSRLRSAADEDRMDALAGLVAAVRAGTVFPPPLDHEEESCPFIRIEKIDARKLAAALERFAMSEPLLAAVALCHFSTEARDATWGEMSPRARSAVRPSLTRVPTVTHSRTRRYSDDLEGALRRAERRIR